MAKLERKTQKIFASVANSNEIAAFGTMKTGNPTYTTDLDVLQNTNYTEGWDEGILEDKAPYLEEMNGVQYGITRQLAYIFQEGLPEYDANTNYAKGSWVKYNSKLYESLVNDNLGHQISDINYWEIANISYGGLPIGTIYPSVASNTFVPYGSVACDGTEYSGVTFKALYDNYLVGGLLQTCSYTEYNQSISTYGFCEKFAVDTVNQTFKVPTIKNKVYQGLSNEAPVVGNGTALGLTDGTHLGALQCGGSAGATLQPKDWAYGAMVGYNKGSATGSNLSNYIAVGVTPDPTKSGMVANLNNAEQILNIKYFVVISTGDLNKAEMDWSEYIRNIQSKANKDGSNVEYPYIKYAWSFGLDGYRIWSDGYCEQWGHYIPETQIKPNDTGTIALTHAITIPNIIMQPLWQTTSNGTTCLVVQNFSGGPVNYFNWKHVAYSSASRIDSFMWRVTGYIGG